MFERRERMASLILRQIGLTILKDIKDHKIRFVTITRVELSEKMCSARVYLSVLGDEKQQKKVLKAVRKATPFFKARLSESLVTRRCPDLFFVIDKNIGQIERLSALMKDVQLESNEDKGEQSE